MSAEPKLTDHKITVLLVDDQPLIGEAVRRMLASDPDIAFHFCKEASRMIRCTASHREPHGQILQDLVMPEIDGLTLVKMFRENEATRETPLIVLSTNEEATTKAEAFALGANDYLVKLPDGIELLARIRHHSKGYINLLQRNEASDALKQSQQMLANELAQAARYVRSLLPERQSTGLIRTDWQLHPRSTDLGGDSFASTTGSDDDRKNAAFYLLDDRGHGVGARPAFGLTLNALRSQSLPQADFRQPGQVLAARSTFQMWNGQGWALLPIWYGIPTSNRRIDYSAQRPPPALLLTGPSAEQASMKVLASQGPMIGADTEISYETQSCPVDDFGRLFLFSDGVYEITRTDSTDTAVPRLHRFHEPRPGAGRVRLDDGPLDRSDRPARRHRHLPRTTSRSSNSSSPGYRAEIISSTRGIRRLPRRSPRSVVSPPGLRGAGAAVRAIHFHIGKYQPHRPIRPAPACRWLAAAQRLGRPGQRAGHKHGRRSSAPRTGRRSREPQSCSSPAPRNWACCTGQRGRTWDGSSRKQGAERAVLRKGFRQRTAVHRRPDCPGSSRPCQRPAQLLLAASGYLHDRTALDGPPTRTSMIVGRFRWQNRVLPRK